MNSTQLKARTLNYFKEAYQAEPYDVCLEIPKNSALLIASIPGKFISFSLNGYFYRWKNN